MSRKVRYSIMRKSWKEAQSSSEQQRNAIEFIASWVITDIPKDVYEDKFKAMEFIDKWQEEATENWVAWSFAKAERNSKRRCGNRGTYCPAWDAEMDGYFMDFYWG